jgi:hypothetical protein
MMVALPVIQVLRFQSEQVEAVQRHRATMNPVARAVQVQRGLLAHRDASAQVLRGRKAMEAPRQQRQLEVEQRTQALVADLDLMRLASALREAQALRDDFVGLATQVTQRQITAPESDAGHRLLVEQALQVMDLVQDLGDDASVRWQDPNTQLAIALTRELPRAVWQLGLSGAAVEVAASQAQRLHQLVERRNLVTSQAAAANSKSALQPSLAQATQAAATSLQAWTVVALTADAQDPNTDADVARTAALLAQWQLFDLAHATAVQALTRQEAQAQSHRLQSMAWMLALALLAAGLWARLWGLSKVALTLPPSPTGAAATDWNSDRRARNGTQTAAQSEAQSETQVLLQRLRWAEAALKTTAAAPAASIETPPRDHGG